MGNGTKKLVIIAVLLVVLIGVIVLFVVSNNSGNTNNINDTNNLSQSNSDTTSTSSESTSDNIVTTINYDSDEEKTDYEISTYITFSKDGIKIDGNGASSNGTTVTITSGGNYSISGTIEDGSVIVDATKEDTVIILLDNVNITSSTTSPIYVKKASKVILTLKDGTKNTLTDASSYVYESADEDEPKATIYSKTDLVINGTGSLNVVANYNDAISSNDGLRILNGNIVVTSVDDGIRGKDYVYIKDGNITIDAKGDGIKSTNSDSDEVGFILIEGGTIKITAECDGMDAQTSLYIKNGTIDITSGGGSVNASTKSSWGSWGSTNQNADSSESSTSSAKGLKATNNLQIDGGKITIDSSDDSLHSNNILTVNSGNITISSGDDGMHSDTKLEINGGTIKITKSYEGIESNLITINDGNISLVATDDGINVSGGNDGSALGGRPGQNNFSSSSDSSRSLTINGGTLVLDSSGDGLDSNGNMYINGGDITVYGTTSGGNGILDYDAELVMTDGVLKGVGTSDMFQTISSNSSVYSINVALSSAAKAGSKASIVNSNGEEILSITSNKSYQAIIFASNKIEKGQTYDVYVDGTKIDSITVSDIVNTVGNINTMNNMGENMKGNMNQNQMMQNDGTTMQNSSENNRRGR